MYIIGQIEHSCPSQQCWTSFGYQLKGLGILVSVSMVIKVDNQGSITCAIDCCIFEWGLTVNHNQNKDYIRKQLRKDTSSIYEKSMRFYNSPQNFGAGPLTRGCTYKKKIAYTRLSLSLSLLHWKREQEERSGGVGPNWAQPPDCRFRPMCSVLGRHTDCYF